MPPESALTRHPLGPALLLGNNGDYTYNWDFLDDDDPRSSSVVDWGMRFLFAGSVVDVDYIKDRLDGKGNDPSISPELDGGRSAIIFVHG